MRPRPALLIAGLLTFTAIGGPVPTSVRAASKRVVRIGHFPNITHAQALYARAGGQFEKKLGVPIEWTSFNAGPTAIEAMFANAIDATFIGPNPAINGFIKSKGEAFVIVAGAAAGGAGLVLRSDAGIQSDKDFGNTIIATPQLGNTQDVAARVWFAEHGYKLKEKGGNVSLLPLANPDQLLMFQKKAIHGAWTVEPWLSRLEVEAGGRLYVDEKTLWPDGRYVTTQLVVRKEFLATNAPLVEALVEALIEVTQQINADKAAAAQVLNAELKKLTGKPLPDAVMTRAMQRVELTWDPIPASLRASAAHAHQIGFLREAPDINGIHSLATLNRVLAAKGLPAVAE
jgi:NitT/TauT family transport system substrate-binding protein